MNKSIQGRLEASEQSMGGSEPCGPVILLSTHETESQALARCGHAPDTEAFFIKLVPLQPRPIGGQHAKA